jgi:hypothetical protein
MSTFCFVRDNEWLRVVYVNADLPGGELNLWEVCEEDFIFLINFLI